jgi:hypothetical protein
MLAALSIRKSEKCESMVPIWRGDWRRPMNGLSVLPDYQWAI